MSDQVSPRCSFIVVGDPGQRTGGYRYDACIVDGLRALGWMVEVMGLAGRFPVPDEVAWKALDRTLTDLPDDSRVVIDGLAMGGLPDVIQTHAGRLRIIALVHHPLADESDIGSVQRMLFLRSEAEALAAVAAVVCTSAFTARRLLDFGVPSARISVVVPGVQAAPVAAGGHHPLRMLCVATITPRKGHDVLVAALQRLGELDWECVCIGSLLRDPLHAQRVARQIHDAGLNDRVRLYGEMADGELAGAYAAADCFVLASHYEGYGMVITEALARGLPVVCTRGGALAETLPPEAGLLVAVDDVEALADALRRMIEDPALRQGLREGACKARDGLRDWADAAAEFARVLDSV